MYLQFTRKATFLIFVTCQMTSIVPRYCRIAYNDNYLVIRKNKFKTVNFKKKILSSFTNILR